MFSTTGYLEAVEDYLDIESRAPSPTSASLILGPGHGTDDGPTPAKRCCPQDPIPQLINPDTGL